MKRESTFVSLEPHPPGLRPRPSHILEMTGREAILGSAGAGKLADRPGPARQRDHLPRECSV